jgi:hypothetical protein
MPGWLIWTVIGLAAWTVASLPLALLAGCLLTGRRAPRSRIMALPGPKSIRVRGRDRSQTLIGSG